MSQTQFFDDWEHVHAPPVLEQPNLESYTLNMLTGERPAGSPWDGYAELWWTDWDGFDEASKAVRARVTSGALDFFHAHELLYVDEYVIVAPPT